MSEKNEWIKCKSKKHPDKFYYFNKSTGESSWKEPSCTVNNSSKTTIDDSALPTLQLQKPKKNIAADRLKRLQNSLKSNQLLKTLRTQPVSKKAETSSLSLQITSPNKKRRSNDTKSVLEAKKVAQFAPSQTSSPLPIKKVEQKPPAEQKLPSPQLSPIPTKNAANARLKDLQVSLEKQQSILSHDDLMEQPSHVQNASCTEDMDWEPSDHFSSCVAEITNNNGTMSEYFECLQEYDFSSNNSSDGTFSLKDFYFVVDTNILLDNLSFVKNLSEKVFGASINTTIMIPYKVIQELDGLKSRDTTSTQATRAIKFLYDKLSSKDPHFQGQNAKHSKEEVIPIENNDDEILNCCLQVQESCKHVMLLSNDVNLKNKAILNGIKILNSTKAELLEPENLTIFHLMTNESKQI